jgi:hypothetical protein
MPTNVWVASGSAGVSFWDKHHDKFINVAEREGNGVDEKALENFVLVMFYPFPATLGRVWVGTRTMGLFMLEFKNELLVSISSNSNTWYHAVWGIFDGT